MPWMEKFIWKGVGIYWVSRRAQANLITSGAEPDKLYPFSSTDPIILFILLLNVFH